VKRYKSGSAQGESACGDESGGLDIFPLKNKDKLSGSEVLAVVDGRAVRGLRCRRLFIVCHSLRVYNLQTMINAVL